MHRTFPLMCLLLTNLYKEIPLSNKRSVRSMATAPASYKQSIHVLLNCWRAAFPSGIKCIALYDVARTIVYHRRKTFV